MGRLRPPPPPELTCCRLDGGSSADDGLLSVLGPAIEPWLLLPTPRSPSSSAGLHSTRTVTHISFGLSMLDKFLLRFTRCCMYITSEVKLSVSSTDVPTIVDTHDITTYYPSLSTSISNSYGQPGMLNEVQKFEIRIKHSNSDSSSDPSIFVC